MLASPEAILNDDYQDLLSSTKICMLVFDEAHCITAWGLEFRDAYRQCASLISVVECPILLLTATLTTEIKKDLVSLLQLPTETFTLALKPDRYETHINN